MRSTMDAGLQPLIAPQEAGKHRACVAFRVSAPLSARSLLGAVCHHDNREIRLMQQSTPSTPTPSPTPTLQPSDPAVCHLHIDLRHKRRFSPTYPVLWMRCWYLASSLAQAKQLYRAYGGTWKRITLLTKSLDDY